MSDDHITASGSWVPDACTLPTAEQPLRLAEFDKFFRTAVRGADRLSAEHLRLRLDGAEGVEETARDLAARESSCCSFFAFAVSAPQPGKVRLDIEVPDGHVAVLDALEADHDYLLDGGVFTPDLISTWVSWKRANEVDPVRLRPTPHEFAMYFDC